MRILHILDHSIPLQSGYTFRTRNILRHQNALGWHTLHVTGLKHRPCSVLEETVDGLHFYRVPGNGVLLGKVPVVNQWQVVRTLARRIEQIIEREKPDILHAHSPALNGLAALMANRRHGLPLVYECRAFWEDAAVDHGTSREHGIRYRLSHSIETRVFRRVDAITTICEGLKRDIVGRGIAEEKITVIPNAVDTEHFSAGSEPDAKLLGDLGLAGKTVLGFIGSFYAYEGIPLLLEALPGILAQHADARLLLVGGGPQEAIIKRRVQELGLEDQVIMTGRIPHGEVQKYYDIVDILIYPRLPMRLTELVTPLKPLEAMAGGRLVVASDVGGHRELIRDNETGMLFAAGSSDALAASVNDLLARRDDWQRIRDRGREFVERERTWKASVNRYPAVYGALI